MLRVFCEAKVQAKHLQMYFTKQAIDSSLNLSNDNPFRDGIAFSTDIIEKLIQSSATFLYVHDLEEKNYHFPNNQAARILGLDEEALNPMPESLLKSIMHPEESVKLDDFFKALVDVRDERISEFECRLRKSDGDYLWFLTKVVPFRRNSAGKVIQAFGVATDVTKLNANNQKLKDSNKHLSTIIESTNKCIWNIDLNYRIIYFNSAAQQFTRQYSNLELKPGIDFFSTLKNKEKIRVYKDALLRSFKGERVQIQETESKDGETLYFETTFNPVTDYLGTPISVTLISRDITDSVKQQQKIAEQNQKFRTVIEATFDRIWSLDRNYRLLDFNTSFGTFFAEAFHTELKTGMNLMEHIPEGEMKAHWINLYERVFTGENIHFETTNTVNGKTYVSELTMLPIRDGEGNVTSLTGLSRNISERILAKKKIQEQANQFSAVMENTSDRIWSVDSRYCLLEMNSIFINTFLTIFGTEPKIGQNILSTLPTTEKQEYWKSLYDRAFLGERIETDQWNLVNGQAHFAEVTMHPVRNPDGAITSVTVFSRNITDRVNSQKKLSEQNILLTAIMESNQNSLFAFDMEDRYIAFNSNHARTIKNVYGADIRIGMKPDEYLEGTPEFNEVIKSRERVRKGESFSIAEEFKTISQQKQIFEMFWSPMLNENGQVVGYSVLSQNITEKIRAKEELQMAEKKFRDLFEYSPDAYFVEDAAGTILDVNQAGLKLQGLSKEKLVGMNIRELVPAKVYRTVLREYKSLFLGITRITESKVWPAEEGEIPVEISGRKLIFQNQPAVLLQVRDIRERKKLEQEREQIHMEKSRQKEELIMASLRIQEMERNRIAAEMHDEIGAGLSKISAISRVIKGSVTNPELVNEAIDKVINASAEIHENIREIIWAMDPKNDLLENLLAYIRYNSMEFMEDSQISFDVSLPDKIPHLAVNGKFRRNVFLVVKETLNNILKHSQATKALLAVSIAHECMYVIITDNGVGFDTKNVPRFKNGLFNMKRRCADIGGTYVCESLPGKGTTVKLYFELKGRMLEGYQF